MTRWIFNVSAALTLVVLVVHVSLFPAGVSPQRVPYLEYVTIVVILPLIWLRLAEIINRWRKPIPPLPPGHCKRCGYDLRASEERCPECGAPIPAATDTPAARPSE